MKQLKKFITLLLAVVLALVPLNTAAASMVPEEGTSLAGYTVILHTNDSHGRAVPDSYNGYMGFTAVSALKKSFEAAGAEVILLDAGDTLHGLPFANLVKGESIVRMMNAAGYTAMTPGNHDFNYGTDILTELSKKMDFKLLSSNITRKDNGQNLLEDNIIIEKNGVKYGIFGLSTPETAYKTNPNNVSGIEFGNPIVAAGKEVSELKAAGAQFIIALSHLGTDKSSEFRSGQVASQVEGINLIVDGHSHSVYEEGIMAGNTMIVSTGDYIQNIGVVLIAPNGKLKAGLVKAADYTGTDPAVDKIAGEYLTEQDELLAQPVGSAAVQLDGVREHVRAGETNLGDLTTDAMRYATGADVAITNGGGIRATIDAGTITKKDLVTVFPFGNYVVTKKVTGKALLEALEHGVSTYPEPLGAFLQVSGITFAIDASKPAGSRVAQAKINGAAIDPEKEYLLATNDFVIAGGDGYTMLADFPVVNEYGSMEDVMADYIKSLGDVTLSVQGRITLLDAQEAGVTEDENAAGGTQEDNAGQIANGTDNAQAEQETTGVPETGEDASAYAVVLLGLAAVSATVVLFINKKEKNSAK